MVDTSKIRVGDEVTVRARVLERGSVYNSLRVVGFEKRLGSCWFAPADVVSHNPAPREIKAGDVVRIGELSAYVWDVQAVSGQRAWISRLWEGGLYERIIPLNTLRHAT